MIRNGWHANSMFKDCIVTNVKYKPQNFFISQSEWVIPTFKLLHDKSQADFRNSIKCTKSKVLFTEF